ncbi:MAG: carboxypeptidase regulatory-like domain-containing protein [Elusimicrobiota bacterium]
MYQKKNWLTQLLVISFLCTQLEGIGSTAEVMNAELCFYRGDEVYSIFRDVAVNNLRSDEEKVKAVLTELVNGLLPEEKVAYLRTAIPAGTEVIGVKIAGEVIYIDFTSQIVKGINEVSLAEISRQVLFTARIIVPAVNTYKITSMGKPLGEYIPKIVMTEKEKVDLQKSLKLYRAPIPPVAPRTNDGPFTGKNISVSPGHGYWYTCYAWVFQRGQVFGFEDNDAALREDHTNWHMMRHVINYLLDGGASVFPCRDMNMSSGNDTDESDIGLAAPNKPWWLMAGKYYIKKVGAPKAVSDPSTSAQSCDPQNQKAKDWKARPYYGNWLLKNGPGMDFHIAFHTNASSNASVRGMQFYVDVDANADNGSDYDGGNLQVHVDNIPKHRLSAQKVYAQADKLIKKYYDPTWKSVAIYYTDWQYSENHHSQAPCFMAEFLYHTNAMDTKALLDEKFRRLAGQAYYKGLCDYWGITEYGLPVTITDLKAYPGSSAGQVRLVWSAPGEDYTYVSAIKYVLKYSNAPIDTKTKFDAATVYPQAWVPKYRWWMEEKVIDGFTPGVTYYFAITSENDTEDISKVSNSAGTYAKNAGVIITGDISGNIKDLLASVAVSTAQVMLVPNGDGVYPDKNGNYRIANLTPGVYTLNITAAGYSAQTKTCAVVAQSTVTVNFYLVSGSSGAINGRAVNKLTGEPVSGVKIVNTSNNNATVYTDTSGDYIFGSLSPGAYFITTQVAGYQNANSLCTVSAGNLTVLDFSLTPSGVTTGNLNVRVLDSVNTLLTLNGADCFLSPENRHVLTNTGGVYSFNNIVSGSHTVTVNLADYAVASSTCSITSGVTAELIIRLIPLASVCGVYGIVTNKTTSAALQDAGISILENSRVAQSGSNGVYEFTNLSSGTYNLAVSLSGYESSTTTFTLGSGERKEVNFELTPLASITEISGRVTDNTGNAIKGATVKVVKGNTVNTLITDANGNYKLSNISAAGYYNVEFSHIGYETVSKNNQYITLGSANVINAQMQPVETLQNVQLSNSVYTPIRDGVAQVLTLKFNVSSGESNVVVRVYDIKGRSVRQMENVMVNGTAAETSWDGNDNAGRAVPGGVYIYQIEAGGKVRTGKILVAK